MRHSLLAQELSLRLAAPVRCPGKTKLDRAEAFLCVYNAITGNADRDVDVDVDWGWGWGWRWDGTRVGAVRLYVLISVAEPPEMGGRTTKLW